MILIPSTPEKLLANAAMMDRIRETARARHPVALAGSGGP
jgi:hypothetical protein